MKKFSRITAISVVVANMVGTGIFTSLGFQVLGIGSGFTILLIWVLGGFISLCGAFAYSELGVMFPRSGGEYNFLSRIYHPAMGFLAGWVSLTVGFSAPVAAAAMAFGKYFSSSVHLQPVMPSWLSRFEPPVILAIFLILGLSLLHSLYKIAGAAFQNIMTLIKISFILVLIFIGIRYGGDSGISFSLNHLALKEMISPAFVISMFFVTYSYSGWNATAYITGEIKNPKKDIPLALILGTGFVTLLYVALTFVFLYALPIGNMKGEIEIGYLFVNQVLGSKAGLWMGLIIALLLISSVSSMIIIGPRVNSSLGEDYPAFSWFSKRYEDAPVISILFQSLVAIIFILTASFENIIILIGFTLNLFTFLSVLGVFIMRLKQPDLTRSYKTFGHPYTSGFFLLVSLWVLTYGFIYKPEESFAGIMITLAGLVPYYLGTRKKRLQADHVHTKS